MRSRIDNFVTRGDELNLFFITASMMWVVEAGLLGLLLIFQIFTGRFLGSSEYGLFASLYGFLTLTTALSHGFRMSHARNSSIKDASGNIHGIFFRDLKWPFLMGLFAGILIFVGSEQLSRLLESQSVTPFLILAINMPLLTCLSALIGSMQGYQWFGRYSLVLATQAVGRLFSLFLFLNSEFGLIEIMFGILMSNLLALLLALFLCRKLISMSHSSDTKVVFKDHLPALSYQVMISLHSTVDVFAARYLLDSVESGNFAVITILGRVVLYGVTPLSVVMLPKMTRYWQQGKSIRSLFFTCLCLTVIGSMLAIMFINFFSGHLLNIFWGKDYYLNRYALLVYSCSMLVLAINYQFFHLYIIVGKSLRFCLPVCMAFLTGFSMIVVLSSSMNYIANAVLMVNVVAFFTMILFAKNSFRKANIA